MSQITGGTLLGPFGLQPGFSLTPPGTSRVAYSLLDRFETTVYKAQMSAAPKAASRSLAPGVSEKGRPLVEVLAGGSWYWGSAAWISFTSSLMSYSLNVGNQSRGRKMNIHFSLWSL